ncbi:MAG TPA: BrxA/BrxB family bacilliredoxin [Bacteroidota bacterium]|nr:BrxA/BrxB family bacilliredoxin [Bacteroidota bacterium]
MYDILVQQIKGEVTRLGVRELTTPGEVDRTLTQQPGTCLLFVNSVCGCAGGIARPALALALRHSVRPDVVATVFASGDREATQRARSYLTNMPPSSPSFALLKNGKLVEMIHRSDIELLDPAELAVLLTAMFDRHCAGTAS